MSEPASGTSSVPDARLRRLQDRLSRRPEAGTELEPPEGHTEAAELLIAKGADVNARMKGGGYTVLDLANLEEQTEIAVLLRKHGAKTGEELEAEGK